MRHLLRWSVAALIVVGIAVIPIRSAPAAPAPGGTPAGSAAKTSRVTLITGDVVEVSQAAPGRYAATIRPGPGRDKITFHTSEEDGKIRVLPRDAVPYLSSGVLDADLFDVTALIAGGYDDASSAKLPLIVQGALPTRGLSVAAAKSARSLASIGGSAIAVDKAGLGDMWRSVVAPQANPGTAARADASVGAFAAGVKTISLDRRIRATLDRSVPQIGAPEAWAAGYDGAGVDIAILDTGVDADHPDLAGKVAQTRNFTDSPDVGDHFGHGTHVAATIVGSGNASGGSRRGVAPGAEILSGKVLNDEGIGFESWLIAGMEWAVEAGADVVNMSLGGPATDGTDPMSEAVNRLTAESGTLFVIAAGNDGPWEGTVSSPGTATAALTVGAVDRDESLADFSSRGPRQGDDAVKPEITAPGVGIVAARAAGTSLGTPVNDWYTTLSGTSMATPHVAGSAALLAQQHPDWDATRLKDALVSTARPNPDLTAFEQGSGRVDVARAVAQHVYGTASVSFGLHEEGGESGTLEKVVRYANDTNAPVSLDLSLQMSNLDSGESTGPAVRLSAQRVTVPAGGTTDVPVTAELTTLARGRHSGWITATGPGGITIRTAISITMDGLRYRVTFQGIDSKGNRGFVSPLILVGDDPRSDFLGYVTESGLTLQVEEGTYLLQALIEEYDPQGNRAFLITIPELEIAGDAVVHLDAREATPVRIHTPRPAEQQTIFSYNVYRKLPNGRSFGHGVMHFSTVEQLSVTPTKPVTRGKYEFSSRWQLVAPMVTATVNGLSGGPLDVHLLHQSPTFDGPRTFRLVYAGNGTEKELTEARVRGAAALMVGSYDRSEQDQIAAAANAGAAVALIVRPADASPWTVWQPIGDREPIPALVVGYPDGQRMLAAAKRGNARLRLSLVVASPYLYDIMQVSPGRVPERIDHWVTSLNTAQVTTRYGENGGFGWAKEQRFGWRPWQEVVFGGAWRGSHTYRIVATPSVREEWISSGDTVWQHRVQHEYVFSDGELRGGMTELPRTYMAGRAPDENWFTPVIRPAAVPGIPSTRTGDLLALRIPEFVDAMPGHYARAGGSDDLDTVSARLWRDGSLLAELPNAWQDVSTTPGAAKYRLELNTQRDSDEWQYATRTETAWEFRTAHVDERTPLPLLQLDYHVSPFIVGLSLRHQPGLPPPTAASVRVELSFDDGGRWVPAPVVGHGSHFWVPVPWGKGAVSIRVHAAAKDGSAVTQTVIRALPPRGGGRPGS